MERKAFAIIEPLRPQNELWVSCVSEFVMHRACMVLTLFTHP